MVEDQIVECFRHGGGSRTRPIRDFSRHGEDSNAVHDATLIEATLPLVPGLVDRLNEA